MQWYCWLVHSPIVCTVSVGVGSGMGEGIMCMEGVLCVPDCIVWRGMVCVRKHYVLRRVDTKGITCNFVVNDLLYVALMISWYCYKIAPLAYYYVCTINFVLEYVMCFCQITLLMQAKIHVD